MKLANWSPELEAELQALEEADSAGGRAPSENPAVGSIDAELSKLQAEEEDYQKQREASLPGMAKKGQSALSDFADSITSPSNLATMGVLKNLDKTFKTDMAGKADRAIFKALDYGSGLFGTALSDAISSKSDSVTAGDYWDALKGKATKPSVFLERDGVKPGKNLSDALPFFFSESGEGLPLKKGGDLDPNVRDLKGFAISTVADPLNYLGFGAGALRKVGLGAKGAAKGAKAAAGTAVGAAKAAAPAMPGAQARILDDAAKFANRGSKDLANQAANVMSDVREAITPIGKALKGLGRSWYRTAFKNPEAQAARKFYTKEMKRLSDVLFENGIWGGAESIANQTDDLVKNLGSARRSLYKQIEKPINLNDSKIYRRFVEGAKKDVPNPLRREGVSDALNELRSVARGVPGGKASAELTSEIASDLTKISPTAYQKRAVYNSSSAARNRIAKDLKDAIYKAADEVRPGMSDEIYKINRDFEPIMKSRKAIDAMATRDAARKAFSQIDGIMAMGGAGSLAAGQALKNPLIGAIPLLAFAGKKGVQMAASTRGATLGGQALKKLGQTSVWDNIIRNLVVKEKLDEP